MQQLFFGLRKITGAPGPRGGLENRIDFALSLWAA